MCLVIYRRAADMFAMQVQSSHLVLSHHTAVDRSVSRDVHVSQIGNANNFLFPSLSHLLGVPDSSLV